MHIFGRKHQVLHCAVCGKELGRHKYRPNEEWDIKGFLCGDCHIEKTKEFILRQQEEKEAPERCALCNKELAEEQDKNKPKWQWNMESGTLLCKACYERKDSDYNKKLNFCSICNGKLGLFYYHPKPSWHIEGNLCRKCWDNQNSAYKKR